MKKLVSIIIAMIILFSASAYAGVIPASAKKACCNNGERKSKSPQEE